MLLTINDYRDQFRNGPVGRWESATGSFSLITNTRWEFRPDGMGRIQETGPFREVRDESRYFAWRPDTDLTILIQRFYELEEGDVEKWIKVKFDFTLTLYDEGPRIILVEVDENGKYRNGFGHAFGMVPEWPLAYLGPVNV